MLCLLILTIVTIIAISFTYKQFIKSHISGWVLTGSGNQYNASIDDIDIAFWAQKVTITGIKLWPDTNAINSSPENGQPFRIATTIGIAKITLVDLHLTDLLFRKEVLFSQVNIYEPVAVINSRYHKVDSTKIAPNGKKGAIKKIAIGSINIIGPNICYYQEKKNGDTTTFTLKGGTSKLEDWEYTSSGKDTTRILLAKYLSIDAAALTNSQTGRLYRIHTPRFWMNMHNGTLSIDSLACVPTVNKAEFYRLTGHRASIFNIVIEKLALSKVQWPKLIEQHMLIAGQLLIEKPWMDIYFSYLPPSKPIEMVNQDPPELLRHLPLAVNIEKLAINKASISYTEFNTKSMMEGTLHFTDVDATGKNLTNIPTVIAQKSKFELTTNGLIMNTSPFRAFLTFNLEDPANAYSIDASASNIEAKDISSVAVALSMMKVKTLHLSRLIAKIHGNKHYVESLLDMRYEHLDLEVERKKDDGPVKKNTIVTVLAKKLFVQSDNPLKGETVRRSITRQNRDKTVVFASTIVKAVKSGAKEIILRDDNLVGKLKHDTLAATSKTIPPHKTSFLRKLFGRKNSN